MVCISDQVPNLSDVSQIAAVPTHDKQQQQQHASPTAPIKMPHSLITAGAAAPHSRPHPGDLATPEQFLTAHIMSPSVPSVPGGNSSSSSSLQPPDVRSELPGAIPFEQTRRHSNESPPNEPPDPVVLKLEATRLIFASFPLNYFRMIFQTGEGLERQYFKRIRFECLLDANDLSLDTTMQVRHLCDECKIRPRLSAPEKLLRVFFSPRSCSMQDRPWGRVMSSIAPQPVPP